MELKKDIKTTEDIQKVVDAFYNKVNSDPVIGPYFSELDWSKHLPTMYRFWSTVILHQEGYKGNPFEKHLKLPELKEKHFERWVSLFTTTVDELFEGTVANEMKLRASSIAFIFQSKLVKG
jgi:hemoglobin